MVDRHNRVKKRKFRRTPGGRLAVHYSRAKREKAECAITGMNLHGTGNQSKAKVRARAKTARRPSVKFGGMLSSRARKRIWENMVLVETGRKTMQEVPAGIRHFVKDAMAVKGEVFGQQKRQD